MATAVTSNHVFGRHALKLYDHDPGGTGAVVVSGDGGTTKNYLDMRDYENFVLVVFNSLSAAASGPTLIEIVAATDTAGTGITVVLASAVVASITVGDNIMLEVNDQQIREVGDAAGLALRYVTGRITCSNAGDECVVLQGRFNSKRPSNALSANNIT